MPCHPFSRCGLTVLAVLSCVALVSPKAGHAANDSSPETIADVSGTTLIAGVSLGEPSERERTRCVWHSTIVSDRNDSAYSLKEENGVTYRLYARTCRAERPSASDTVTYHWIPQISESTLATQTAALSWGMLPVPMVGTAPPSHRGVVNVPMWWWVSPRAWRTISVSAWIPTIRGPLVVTVTAKPNKLVVDPGDPRARNSGRFSCEGPGQAWREADGDAGRSSCMHTYRHGLIRSSGSVSIQWSISWKSNMKRGGRLPTVHTTRRVPVSVAEIQALVNE